MVDEIKIPKEIKVVIDGQEFVCPLRSFKSGKEGFGVYGTQKIGGYPFRVSCNIIKM